MIFQRVKAWGGSISTSTWEEFEGIKKRFLTNFLKVKSKTPYHLLLLAIGTLLIEVMEIERVVAYMLKVTHSHAHRLPCMKGKV